MKVPLKSAQAICWSVGSKQPKDIIVITQLFEKIESDPKSLFFVEGIGAILSAFLLGVVLVRFESIFGIPPSTLYLLAAIPIFFAIYDFIRYRKDEVKIGRFLKAIAIMNLLYCCVSIGFALYHINTITNLGWTYILVEISIVITLSTTELRIANRLKQKTSLKWAD